MGEFKFNRFYQISTLNGLLMPLVVTVNINSHGLIGISGALLPLLILFITPMFIAPTPKNNKTVQALFNSRSHNYVLFSLFIPGIVYLVTMSRIVLIFYLFLTLIIEIALFFNVFTMKSDCWCLRLTENCVTLSYGKKHSKIEWKNIESIEEYKLLGISHLCIIPKDSSFIEGKFRLIDKIRNYYFRRNILSFPEHIFDSNSKEVKAMIRLEYQEKKETF